MGKLSYTQFLIRAKNIHGDFYDYPNEMPNTTHFKMAIICPDHGIFEQTPNKHMQGRGCSKCKSENLRRKFSFTYKDFIEKSKEAHGEKYEYPPQGEYTNNSSVMTIRCYVHGDFRQIAMHHFKGSGCPSCYTDRRGKQQRFKSAEMFVSKAKIIHGDKYDYSNSIYIKAHDPIEVSCEKHGNWITRPSLHLSGHGCPSCISRISNKERFWLDSLDIINRQVKLPNLPYIVDGFDLTTNTVYEFNGDFWHGNPTIFPKDAVNPINKIAFGELYERTLVKERKIIEAGYNLVSKWESDS